MILLHILNSVGLSHIRPSFLTCINLSLVTKFDLSGLPVKLVKYCTLTAVDVGRPDLTNVLLLSLL